MKGLFATILLALFCSAPLLAQTKSLLIEDMTWTEVRDAIAAGKTSAIYYAGSIEQNGPGMALGKHVFIARYLGPKIAEQLGDALVYPVRLETGVSASRAWWIPPRKLATCDTTEVSAFRK